GRALEHRFDSGELEGHAFGNLLIAAMAATTGDFAEGVAETARLLGALGQVFPATLTPVVLKGTGTSGELSGQAEITRRGGISHVALLPSDPGPPPGAVEALLAADQIVIGPGSLYTSLLATIAVPALGRAICESSAQRVYVANLREQRPETAGFDVADHVTALLDHGIELDVVLVDGRALKIGDMPEGIAVEVADLAGPGLLAHDPALLARALSALVLAVTPVAGEK
ncbi:MAG: gluconeogenesis factor YvcK family protein, partial [Acidimicrobiales bacterium]